MLAKCTAYAGLAVLIALSASASPAAAHHPSGSSSTGGSGPIATISATTLEKGQSVAGVVVEFISLDQLSLDQMHGHPHPHSLDGIYSTSLVFAYGITNDLSLSLRLPFIRRTNILDAHEPHDLGDAAGVGDLSVLGQYRFLNNRPSRMEAALLLGAKLPTGDTSVDSAAGERFEAEFQPGSGSVDYLLGLAFTKRFGAWSFDTNVLYQFTNAGVQDTNLGDRFLYNAAASYRMHGSTRPSGRMNAGLPPPMYHGGPKAKHQHDESPPSRGPTLDLVLEVNGEWHDHQRIGGVKDIHSGGNTVYLSPGVRLSVDRWSGFVSLGVPIFTDLNGIQPEPEWRIISGVAVNF
jgi:hypothetical protein